MPEAVAGVLLGRDRAVATTAVPSTIAAGDGQGMSCLHDVCVLEVFDGTARWRSHARETAPIQR